MSIGAAKGSRGLTATQQLQHQVYRYPAPVRGMDIRKAIGSEDLLHSIYTYNLVPYEFGLRVRSGYREWQKNVESVSNSGVRTLVPFSSVTNDPADERLFAMTTEGIFDVTVAEAAPVLEIAFPSSAGEAGYGTYTHYVDDSGDDILFYADAENGLYKYETGAWLFVTTITGPSMSDIIFIVAHKQRIWIVEKGTTDAWYLAIGASAGAATVFHFGSKFRHGGGLQGLFNWSVDGGAGVDDLLVAVSHAGDVIVYTGSDPALADWEVRGSYYIGQIPNTPRFGSEQGGELYLLSAYGVSSMNDLLRGVDSNAIQSDAEGVSVASKVAGLIRERMAVSIELAGWDISPIPSEGGLLISTPTIDSEASIQFHYNFATQGWGIWRDVPINCFEEYGDTVYFGTADSRVCRMDVAVDNQLIDPVSPEFNGEDIYFSTLTSYSSLETAGLYKRAKLVRPDFISTRPPTHSSTIRYDFDIGEGVNFQLTQPTLGKPAVWDISNWDQAVWGSSSGTTFPSIGGAWGSGRYVAIATVGTCRAETRLVGWDLIYDRGGPMR